MRMELLRKQLFISNDSRQTSKIKNSEESVIKNYSINSLINFSKNCEIQNGTNSIIKFSKNCKIINCNNCIIEFSTNITLINKSNIKITKNREEKIMSKLRNIVKEKKENVRRNITRPIVRYRPRSNAIYSKIGNTFLCEDKLNIECNICKDAIEFGEAKTILKCLHNFHKVCIKKWSENQNNCPTCRTEF